MCRTPGPRGKAGHVIPEFDKLAGRYLDGTATRKEVKELNELLRKDGKARREFYLLARQDVCIRDILTTEMAAEDEEGFKRLSADVSGRLQALRRKKTARRISPAVLTAAAALLVAAALVFFYYSPPPDAPADQRSVIARLSEIMPGNVLVKRNQNTFRVGKGSLIRAGDVIRTDEHCKVRVSIIADSRGRNAVRLCINGDSSVQISTPDRLVLKKGDIYCEVDERSAADQTPFTVQTASGQRVRVTGTQFEVRVREGRSTVSVLKGGVAFSEADKTVAVRAGEFSSAAAGGIPSHCTPQNPTQMALWAGAWRTGTKLKLLVDFNTNEWEKYLRPVQGKITYFPGRGVGKSGCIRTGDGISTAAVTVPVHGSLPLKVTAAFFHPQIDLRGLQPEIRKVLEEKGAMTMLSWTQSFYVGVYHGLAENRKRVYSENEYKSLTFYVTGDYIVSRQEGRKGLLNLILHRNVREDALLTVVNRGDVFLDNLTVTALSRNELPDISRYVQAIEQVPPEKRYGTLLLPQFKSPIPGQKVFFQFAGENSPSSSDKPSPPRE